MAAEPEGSSTAPTCTVDVEVRYAETDAMAVVHHSVFVIYFELARTHLCLQSGFHYADIEKLGYFLMVTGVECRYHLAARYGDTLQVACRLTALRSRGPRFSYAVTRAGDTLVTGATEHLWVDRATGRPCRTPPPLAEPFRRLAGLL